MPLLPPPPFLLRRLRQHPRPLVLKCHCFETGHTQSHWGMGREHVCNKPLFVGQTATKWIGDAKVRADENCLFILHQ